MSLRKLQNQIRTLPQREQLQANDIEQLREAAGKKVSNVERATMDAFVDANVERFSPEAILALKKQFSIALPQKTKLSFQETTTLSIQEASGVAAYDAQRFLVIDDEKGLFLHSLSGESRALLKAKDHKELSGLEGVTLSEDKQTAYIVSEDSRRIYSTHLSEDNGVLEASQLKELGRLPKLGKEGNKSWEGIEILPGRFTVDGRDKMIAVHEGSPRRIAIFSLPELEEEVIMSLPKILDDQLRDLSDLAVCPNTGHIFLLSDESSRIAELEIVQSHLAGPGALLFNQDLRAMHTFDLPPGKKSEGLSFQGDSLWVSSELDRSLTQFTVKRS